MLTLFLGLVPCGGHADESSSEVAIDADRLGSLHARIRRLRALGSRYARDERSVLGDLEELTRTVALAEAELALAQAEHDAVEADIISLRAEEARLTNAIDSGKASLRRAMLSAYERRVPSWFALLLAAKDPSEVETNLTMIGRAGKRQSESIAALRERQAELGSVQQRLGSRASELVAQLIEVERRRQLSETARDSKRAALDGIVARKSDAVAALRATSKELGGLVGGLSTRAAPTSTEFRRRKGRLPWPTNGPISRRFGLERHPKLKTLIQHQGIELAAEPGLAVRAVHEGEIAYADWFKRYGNLVILDHGDGYFTLYAQMSEIVAEVGSRATAGALLGFTGETGTLGGSGLYFELRHGSEPINPEPWLTRRP